MLGDIIAAILLILFILYHLPTEDSHLKEGEGRSPMSRWEMNVGWR